MTDGTLNSKLALEEKKAIKLFLWLFFILYYSFDAFYFYVLPIYNKSKQFGIPKDGLGIWLYVFIAALLLISIYILKKRNIYKVKYFLLFGYLLITFIDDMLTYYGHSKPFASGNAVEALFILFSPIFVNKKYFLTALIGIIGKDIFMGIILRDLNVVSAIVLYAILGAIACLILNRFFSYIKSLSIVHEDLRQMDKLVVIGQMAAAIGHEIRNPLAALKGFTQLQHEQYPNTNDFYPIMIQEIDRINYIVNDLMYLGNPKSIQIEKANIEEMIDYTLSLTHQQAEMQGILIETRKESLLPLIECDTKQIKQVFINLIKNAIEAMPEGGTINIQLKVSKEHEIYISIEDEGCGISEEVINSVGKPFVTTKKDGTGLGLMVTNQIINDHQGKLKFQNRAEKGAKAEVWLPIKQK